MNRPQAARHSRSFRTPCFAALVLCVVASGADAQTVDPFYAGSYTVVDLGTLAGLPTPYGGLSFKFNDPDTLLIGGAANQTTGAIYAVGLQRGCEGQIIGFAGAPTLLCSSQFIDGGIDYGPANVLFFTTYSNNTIGQVKPGSAAPDRIINLTPLGVGGSTGTLTFVPAGFPGAGSLKILSYSANRMYDADVSPDGSGTFNITNVVETAVLEGGPEGIVYIAGGNPQFAADSVLISQYGQGRVSSYEVNASGDAVPATRRDFITGLNGVEGAATDPVTGDFLFSTFGGNSRVVIVRGFDAPCPADFTPPGGNGQVDVDDLIGVILNWGNACVLADINRSGLVDVDDLIAVILSWGVCN